VPNPLPEDPAKLAQLIERGSGTTAVFEALGDALSAQGDSALAYRAYDRAQLMKGADGVALQRKKDRCEPVSERVIERERHEAKVWVDALQSFERARIAAGEDPRDLTEFYEQYGRPEDDLEAIIRSRQLSFWAATLAIGLGLAFLIGSGRLRRRIAALPLALAVLCIVAALMSRDALPYFIATIALIVGAGALALRGKRAA